MTAAAAAAASGNNIGQKMQAAKRRMSYQDEVSRAGSKGLLSIEYTSIYIYIYLDICGQIRLHLPAAKPLGSKRKTQHFVEQTMHTHTQRKKAHTHSEDTHTEGTQTQGAHTHQTHTGHSYTGHLHHLSLCLLCASFTFLLHTLRGTCTSGSSALWLWLCRKLRAEKGRRVR